MTEIERIPQEVLDRAHRRLARQIAATLLVAMAETDVGFDEIARRLGEPPSSTRRWFNRMASGDGGAGLCMIAAMATALDCQIHVSIHSFSQANPDPPLPSVDKP